LDLNLQDVVFSKITESSTSIIKR